jgi:hypothetical protein
VDSPLAAADRGRISRRPYPHVVVDQAVDPDISRRLLAELPPLETVTKTEDYPSNQGYALPAHEALHHAEVSPLWRELIRSCLSREFLAEVADLFGEEIRARFPRLEEEAGDLRSMRVGMRHVDTFADAEILLDAEILVTTPVTGEPSSSRSPHVDDTTRLFNGQLYFPVPGDDAPGGDVELYRFRDGPGGFSARNVDPGFIEPVASVPYELNTFLFMLNGLDAVHAVTVRPPTPSPRYLLNVIAHVEQPLFDVQPYQAA